jgi:hypothetical protein
MKARLAIGAAVLVGGGAAGIVAVSSSHGTAAGAQSAGYTTSPSTVSVQVAVTTAFNDWSRWPTQSLTSLTKMTTMRSYSESSYRGSSVVIQRGIVLLATKKFLVVKSTDGALHLWWLTGNTAFKNVSSTQTGWSAMSGSSSAAWSAMSNNMVPVADYMIGSMSAMNQFAAPTAASTTVTINTAGETIKINITKSTATTWTETSSGTTTSYQSAWWHTTGIARGDLVLVAGSRVNGALVAKLVLFAPTTSVSAPSDTSWSAPSSSSSSTGTYGSSNGQTFVTGTHS